MNISDGKHRQRSGIVSLLLGVVLPRLAQRPPRAERLPDATDLPAHLQRDIGIGEPENDRPA